MKEPDEAEEAMFVKWEPPKDPIEIEANIKQLVPLPAHFEKFYNIWYRQYREQNPYIDYVEAKKQNKKAIRDIKQGWANTFQQWLMGTSMYNVKTSEIDGTTRLTPWGCQSLMFLPDVRAYLEKFLRKKAAFQIKLASLYLRGPTNLDEAYIYFKYIVTGELLQTSSGAFLEEFNKFFPNTEEFNQMTDNKTDVWKPNKEIAEENLQIYNLQADAVASMNAPQPILATGVKAALKNPSLEGLNVVLEAFRNQSKDIVDAIAEIKLQAPALPAEAIALLGDIKHQLMVGNDQQALGFTGTQGAIAAGNTALLSALKGIYDKNGEIALSVANNTAGAKAVIDAVNNNTNVLAQSIHQLKAELDPTALGAAISAGIDIPYMDMARAIGQNIPAPKVTVQPTPVTVNPTPVYMKPEFNIQPPEVKVDVQPAPVNMPAPVVVQQQPPPPPQQPQVAPQQQVDPNLMAQAVYAGVVPLMQKIDAMINAQAQQQQVPVPQAPQITAEQIAALVQQNIPAAQTINNQQVINSEPILQGIQALLLQQQQAIAQQQPQQQAQIDYQQMATSIAAELGKVIKPSEAVPFDYDKITDSMKKAFPQQEVQAEVKHIVDVPGMKDLIEAVKVSTGDTKSMLEAYGETLKASIASLPREQQHLQIASIVKDMSNTLKQAISEQSEAQIDTMRSNNAEIIKSLERNRFDPNIAKALEGTVNATKSFKDLYERMEESKDRQIKQLTLTADKHFNMYKDTQSRILAYEQMVEDVRGRADMNAERLSETIGTVKSLESQLGSAKRSLESRKNEIKTISSEKDILSESLSRYKDEILDLRKELLASAAKGGAQTDELRSRLQKAESEMVRAAEIESKFDKLLLEHQNDVLKSGQMHSELAELRAALQTSEKSVQEQRTKHEMEMLKLQTQLTEALESTKQEKVSASKQFLGLFKQAPAFNEPKIEGDVVGKPITLDANQPTITAAFAKKKSVAPKAAPGGSDVVFEKPSMEQVSSIKERHITQQQFGEQPLQPMAVSEHQFGKQEFKPVELSPSDKASMIRTATEEASRQIASLVKDKSIVRKFQGGVWELRSQNLSDDELLLKLNHLYESTIRESTVAQAYHKYVNTAFGANASERAQLKQDYQKAVEDMIMGNIQTESYEATPERQDQLTRITARADTVVSGGTLSAEDKIQLTADIGHVVNEIKSNNISAEAALALKGSESFRNLVFTALADEAAPLKHLSTLELKDLMVKEEGYDFYAKMKKVAKEHPAFNKKNPSMEETRRGRLDVQKAKGNYNRLLAVARSRQQHGLPSDIRSGVVDIRSGVHLDNEQMQEVTERASSFSGGGGTLIDPTKAGDPSLAKNLSGSGEREMSGDGGAKAWDPYFDAKEGGNALTKEQLEVLEEDKKHFKAQNQMLAAFMRAEKDTGIRAEVTHPEEAGRFIDTSIIPGVRVEKEMNKLRHEQNMARKDFR